MFFYKVSCQVQIPHCTWIERIITDMRLRHGSTLYLFCWRPGQPVLRTAEPPRAPFHLSAGLWVYLTIETLSGCHRCSSQTADSHPESKYKSFYWESKLSTVVIEKKQKNQKKKPSTLEVSFYPVERQWSHPVPVTFKVNISCLLIDAHGKVRVIHP